jgi:hypothetical protein
MFQINLLPLFSRTLNVEAADTPEILEPFNQTKWWHMAEETVFIFTKTRTSNLTNYIYTPQILWGEFNAHVLHRVLER